MPTKGTSPHTLRFRDDVWEWIAEEAKVLKMSRPEYIRCRVEAPFFAAREVSKRTENVSDTNDQPAAPRNGVFG